MTGPEPLEDDLVLCLVAGAARLDDGRGPHGAVVLTEGVGEGPVVHEPDVLPLYNHGLHTRTGAQQTDDRRHLE